MHINPSKGTGLLGTNGYNSDNFVGVSRTEGRLSVVLALDAKVPQRCDKSKRDKMKLHQKEIGRSWLTTWKTPLDCTDMITESL